MITESAWLIDKSALVRLAYSTDPDLWANRIQRGRVHISNLTRLEVGYSAQSGDQARRAFREPPIVAMPVEYLTPAIEDRALRCASGRLTVPAPGTRCVPASQSLQRPHTFDG